MELITLPKLFGICKLEPDATLPDWLSQNEFTSVTWTSEEISIVSDESIIPEWIECDRGWRCFKVKGPLDFSLTGVLESLALPLAKAGISIFAVSTYNTDYLMVKETRFKEAKRVLMQAEHHVKSGKREEAT